MQVHCEQCGCDYAYEMIHLNTVRLRFRNPAYLRLLVERGVLT
jgi:hypothetical protein